jgi:hypothetical protein
MKRSRKLAGVLAAIGLAAGFSMAGTGTARADVIPPSGTWAEIFNPYIHPQGFSLCVDNPGGSRDIQKIQLYHCHGYASNGAPQRWFFTAIGGYNKGTGTVFTTYRIRNQASILCIGFPETFPTGVDLIQEPCSSPDIEWALEPVDPSSSNPDFMLETLEPRFSFVGHWCMAASNFTGNSPTRLVAEPCEPTDTRQLWNLG